uniref:Uncharacterized protein n=1 Tax=Rhizophora mucronata TaxID=61149 RepID=A0A2P2M784_RHIMU
MFHQRLLLESSSIIHAWQLGQLQPMGKHLLLFQPRCRNENKCSVSKEK